MSYARAKRSLGQNFLVDRNIARKIVACLELEPDDMVLEIGPGRGALTMSMAAQAGRVIALEKDRGLAFEMIRHPGILMINMDALHMDWSRLDRIPGIKIAGNLPYNIAQVLLWDLAAGSRLFRKAVFMIQKEVAGRISASPGSREYGALSVWIQSFARVSVLFHVAPTVFRPKPRVESSVIALTPLPREKFFFVPWQLSALLKIMFQNRRKQVGKIMKTYWNERKNYVLEHCLPDPSLRPEQLSPEKFQMLSRHIYALKNGS